MKPRFSVLALSFSLTLIVAPSSVTFPSARSASPPDARGSGNSRARDAPAPRRADTGVANPDSQSGTDGTTLSDAPSSRRNATRSDSDGSNHSAESGREPTRDGEPSEDGFTPAIPADRPADRLKRAERAFENGEFERIPPLLEPLLEPNSTFENAERRIRARELLGVGFHFEAQQASRAARRDILTRKARKQFLELLRERPGYELDSLIFPASAVDLFQSVKENHSEELAERRASGSPAANRAGSGGVQPLYIEREVERHLFIWNLVPGGAGQFQNRDPLKGILFGAGQLAAVGVSAAGAARIQSLCPGLECSSETDFESARQWRNVQIAAWGGFGLLYAISVVDAILNYKPREVHIRTLDEPPPELSEGGGSTGNGPDVRIGLGGVRIRW